MLSSSIAIEPYVPGGIGMPHDGGTDYIEMEAGGGGGTGGACICTGTIGASGLDVLVSPHSNTSVHFLTSSARPSQTSLATAEKCMRPTRVPF